MSKRFAHLRSANFRRDYVAGFAIVLFLLVIIGEIAITFWIPYYVREGSALAFQEQRYILARDFDNLRISIVALKPKNEIVAGELNIIYWNLNRLAPYIRENIDRFDRNEVAELHQDIMEMWSFFNEFKRTREPLSRDIELNTDVFFQKIGDKL